MSEDNLSLADPFGAIADEFVEAFRQGKRPSVEEFARRYPDHADEIREVLPALVLMEKAKSPDDSGSDGGKPTAPAAMPHLRQLGDYQIVREVGRGGMGVVYEAEQVSLGRHVALKVLPSHALLDPRQLARFQREARSAARLHHTNIVPVFGFGDHDGLHYYVMQFIQGLGLDEVLVELKRLRRPKGVPCLTTRDRPNRTQDFSAVQVAHSLLTGAFFPNAAETAAVVASPAVVTAIEPASAPRSESTIHLPGQTEATSLNESGRQYWQSVARVGMQIADALAYAASQGVLHRDIKPSNLLLDGQGNVWVTDFGLAKGEADSDNLTHTGDIVGTLRYMAPERFSGRGDVRSDVYSLGLTLYELLTLRPAFDEADRNKLIKQVMHDEPVRPRKVNSAVPRDLETVVLKAIAREPAHRYQTPVEMAEDLKRFVEDRPVKARRVSETEKFLRWCRRNPLPASLLATIVVIFLVGFAGVIWQWQVAETARKDEKNQRGRAEALRQDADQARQKAEAEKERAEVTLYFSNIARAQLEYRANNVADAEAILDRCPTERRSWEWHFLKGLNHADLFTIKAHDTWVEAVAYSPDGKLIASAGGGNPYYAAQGPDTIRPGEVILWDAATGERIRTLGGHTHLVRGIAFSPDGKQLASACYDAKVRVFDVPTGKELYTKTLSSGGQCVSFSPDGKLLAAGELSGDTLMWDAVSGQERFRCRVRQSGAVSLAFTPDSRHVAILPYLIFQSQVWIWDLSTGKAAPPLDSPQAGFLYGNAVAISPDGRYLAAGDSPSLIKLWELSSGRLVRTLTGHLGYVRGLAFSPDGLFLVSASDDSTIRVWEADSGKETMVFRGHVGQVHGVAFNPDGTRLVSGGIDGTIKVWDLTLHPEHSSLRADQFVRMNHEIEALGFTDGGQILRLAQMGGAVVSYQPMEHTELDCLSLDLNYKWLTPAEPACLDAAGRLLAGVSQDKPTVAKVWDAGTGKERLILRGHTVPLWHVTVNPGGRRVATGSARTAKPDRIGEVKVWDGETGKPLFELAEKGLGVTRLALSPDGDRVAVAGTRYVADPAGKEPQGSPFITVFAVADGRVLRHFTSTDDAWWAMAFSGDGRRLAAASGVNKNVLIWDLAADEPIIINTGPEMAMDVAFSPDGHRLAVAGRPMVKLLDALTGEEILVLRGEAHVALGTGGYNPRVRWSPDGTLLAATCGGSISVWSAAGTSPEARAARLRAADRRAVVYHLTMARSEFGRGRDRSARFHLSRVRRADLGSPWELAQRGLALLNAGENDQANVDLVTAQDQVGPNAEMEFGLGYELAALGRWEQAAPHFDKYFRLGVCRHTMSALIAVLPLYLNDGQAYRRYCQILLDRFGPRTDPYQIVNAMVWALLIGDSGVEPQALVQMADRCLPSLEKVTGAAMAFAAKGMAEYRAGRIAAAVPWLNKAVTQFGENENRAVIHLFLSMAHHRLNQPAKAKEEHQQALQLIEKEFGSLDQFQPRKGPWFGWVYCQVVRREAEAVLNESKPVKKSKD